MELNSILEKQKVSLIHKRPGLSLGKSMHIYYYCFKFYEVLVCWVKTSTSFFGCEISWWLEEMIYFRKFKLLISIKTKQHNKDWNNALISIVPSQIHLPYKCINLFFVCAQVGGNSNAWIYILTYWFILVFCRQKIHYLLKYFERDFRVLKFK